MKDEILLADLKMEYTRNVPGMSVPGMSGTREASKKSIKIHHLFLVA